MKAGVCKVCSYKLGSLISDNSEVIVTDFLLQVCCLLDALYLLFTFTTANTSHELVKVRFAKRQKTREETKC